MGSRSELAWWDRFVTASLSYKVDLVSTESVWGCWHNSPAIDRSQELAAVRLVLDKFIKPVLRLQIEMLQLSFVGWF